MKKKMSKYIEIIFTFTIILLTSCTKEESSESMDQTPIVTVLFSPNALGDHSFSDNIYRGVEEAAAQYGIGVLLWEPATIEEGTLYLRYNTLIPQLST